MIFYGTRSSNIKNGEIRNVTCPHCQANVSMNYNVFGKYAHIYWIPFFPMGKTNIVECRSCKASYDVATVDQSIKDKFKKEQEQNPTKTPLTHFSLLFLFGIGILFAVYFGLKGESDTKEFAKNPKVGDVFYEALANGHFSTSKISKITKDSIYVLQNNKESIKKKDVSKQSAEEANFTMEWAFSKKKYNELATKGDTIYKILRD
jgi:zinc-ribbon family